MTLPDELVEVLDLVGVDWPQIDEDEVKASAKDYRNLADGIRDAVKEGNDACSHIVGGKSKGETVKAIDRRWGKLTTRDLATFAKGCDDLAGALDDCAGLIVTCKVAIITKLSATAAAATAGVIGMIFTAGLSGLLSAAAIGAARLIILEAIDYAIEQVTSIVTDKIEGKILAEIEGLFSDQLGGGGTHDVMAMGGADMAMDLVIEFDEFERSAGDYKKTAANFDKRKGEFKDGGAGRKSSVKKDSRFHKLSTVMDKAEDAVDKKADEMVKTLEDHGGKIDKSKGSHKEEDDHQKKKLEKCKQDGDGEVRAYLLNADGSVERLYGNGKTGEIDGVDKARLDGVVLNDGKAWIPSTPKEKSEFYADSKHPGKTSSTKIAFASKDDLVQATQAARIARDDYKGTNYAAGRYVDPDGTQSILVGYSNKNGHSERMIGRPLLHNGKQDGLTEVFTEREPCRKNPECARWLDYYFKQDVKVTHVADYYTPEGKTTNKEHTQYLDYLKKLHGK
ncbi:nucleic acid/nucleotide deaminase domain-containing protein [Streptomyces sp. NPDC051907]|uniref:nucleic acid/nucleotide deaminase domain-containing protein n=1 Tax=Streptomyces sp. NPDC051907 TaxID=3155284 RepID=UPI0034405267